MSDRIFLHGIELFAHHGLFAEEARLGQRFIVDIDWWVDVHDAAEHDSYDETVGYDKVYETVTKVSGELLCDYYHHRFGVDTRGVRYPGIISNVTLPGGGTTDYAVAIYYEAIKSKKYTCYLKEGTYLDMMYMPDAIKAAIDLMEADPAKLKHRNAFNATAMSFAPEHVLAAIKKHIPELTMDYDVDPVRQAIAESWPNKMDDSCATEEWGWSPEYDLDKMTEDMLQVLSARHEKGEL